MEVPGRKGRRCRTIVAWIGTATLLLYLGLTTDLNQVWEAVKLANLTVFPVTVVGFTLLTWLTDSAITRLLLVRCGIAIKYHLFARIKGASYILNIINYNLGLVLMAAFVTRHSNRGWKAAGSPFILLNFIDLSAMGFLMLLILALAGSPMNKEATLFLIVAAIGGAIAGPAICAFTRLRLKILWLDRILRNDLLSAFKTIRVRDLLLITSLRMIFVSEYILMTWALLRCFRFTIPLAEVAVYNPILGLIGFIPISISGIGTTQIVAREFFAPFAPPDIDAIAAVDAYSTASIFSVLLVRIVIALICLPSISKLYRSEADAPGRLTA